MQKDKLVSNEINDIGISENPFQMSVYTDIVSVLRILLINSWMIIILGGLGGVGAYLYVSSQAPQYQGYTSLIVLPVGDVDTIGTPQYDALRILNLNVIGTYIQILKSNVVTENAHDALLERYTRQEIQNTLLEVRPVSNSSVVTLISRSPNEQLAADLVSQIAVETIENSPQTLESFVDLYPMEILDEARTSEIGNNRSLIAIMGGLAGAALGVVFAFLSDGLSRYRKSRRRS